MLARLPCALAVVVVVLATAASPLVHAGGERSPMVGGAVIASQTTDEAEVAGLSLEVALWWNRIGLALEGSRQWDVATVDGPRVTTLAASARLLAYDHLIPSLLEPSDVELGLELHGIVQREWWDDVPSAPQPLSYGAGIAVRLRGGSDDYFSRLLLAESRLFVRVLKTRAPESMDVIAKGSGTVGYPERDLTVIIGLGVLFGGGDPAYCERFRSRWPEVQ